MSRALVGSISFLVVLAHAYLNFHGVYARPFKRRDATFDWNSVSVNQRFNAPLDLAILSVLTSRKVNPSPTLDWVPCYQNFTCTKLEVPLDYANASAGMTGIAFIKFAPPGVSETAPNIIFNDGTYPSQDELRKLEIPELTLEKGDLEEGVSVSSLALDRH